MTIAPPASAQFALHVAPLVPEALLYALTGVACVLFLMALRAHRKGIIWRVASVAAFLCVLWGPSLIVQERSPVPDVAVIVVDETPSQSLDSGSLRLSRTHAARDYLKESLAGQDSLEVREVHVPESARQTRETRLFEAMERAFADVPPARRAGALLITDGQAHDVPKSPETFKDFGPVHVLLSGDRNEKDRRIVITQAPAYGIVGQDVSIGYKILQTEGFGGDSVTLHITYGDGRSTETVVPVGKNLVHTLPITHAGQNVAEFRIETDPQEITAHNNRAAVLVNGVRDRLKVLLVSGKPHHGTRVWRDILTSDPGVDLVHFTILRDASKMDFTPSYEMSLIPFPFHELFEEKLEAFDLIVFDRFDANGVVPGSYFANIARYVERGGAVLVSAGPEFFGTYSLFDTPLRDILPASPSGESLMEAYRPALTAQGRRHPVTQNLAWQTDTDPSSGGALWGRWMRLVPVTHTAESGRVLMEGARGNPLLILDRVRTRGNQNEEGRVALLASDQIWLWARGFDGGGPYADLLRRLIHWLMKEPELEEDAMDLLVEGDTIRIRKRLPVSADDPQGETHVLMHDPEGRTKQIPLTPMGDGWAQGRADAPRSGIYRFGEGNSLRFVISGESDPPEWQDVLSTPARLAPLTRASGGGVLWLTENPRPAIRMVRHDRVYQGTQWLGLRQSGTRATTALTQTPLLPAWLSALILLGLTGFAWWREA